VKFNYDVRVTFDDGKVSPPAYDTITGVNDPPVVGTTAGLHLLADSYTVFQASQGAKVTTLTISQPGVLGNDSAGADSKPTSLAAVAVTSGATRMAVPTNWRRMVHSLTRSIRNS
jgi:hypothetical protein